MMVEYGCLRCQSLQHRVNLTKTVRKYPLDAQGRVVGDVVRDLPEPKYEELLHDIQEPGHAEAKPVEVKIMDTLDAATFPEAIKKYPILLVLALRSAPNSPYRNRNSFELATRGVLSAKADVHT